MTMVMIAVSISPYLSTQFNDDVQLSIHRCKSLIRHVTSGSTCADEDVAAAATAAAAGMACLKANVLNVRMKPTVCLAVHRLWTQRSSNKVDRLTLQ